jgi:hypothetical protein
VGPGWEFDTPRPLAEDGRLTMEREPDVVATGPIAGRLVSELSVDGKPSLDVAGYRLSRFAEGAVGRPRNVL